MTALRIVLVGYGPVGARFVEELLPAVQDGAVELTVVAGEDIEAYNRVLVAEYAVGNTELDSMIVGDRTTAEEAGARVLLGVAATSIDRAARIVRLSTGEELGYDRLVLATGSRANVPTLDGVERHRRDLASLEKYARHLVAHDDELPEGITALRDLADADRVLEAVRERRRIIVLGAGVLGLELALAAAHAGAQVCVVHHGPHPMPRNLDRGGGQVLRAALRRAGITVIAHSRAEAVAFRTDADGGRRFDMLVTADGKQLRGDLLVLSCGVSPRNELATLAGLRTAVGIVVHPDLRSWSDPDVYAIGDCAAHANPYADGAVIRLESVQNANDMANTAARAICGDPQPYDAVPWFWSNQYDLKLQTVGLSIGHDLTVLRGDPESRSFSVAYLKAGRLIALECVNRTRDYAQGRKLIEAKAVIDPEVLRAAETLKDLV